MNGWNSLEEKMRSIAEGDDKEATEQEEGQKEGDDEDCAQLSEHDIVGSISLVSVEDPSLKTRISSADAIRQVVSDSLSIEESTSSSSDEDD
jgi:hypothetical protein